MRCKWFNRQVFKSEGALVRVLTDYNRRRHNKDFMDKLDMRAREYLDDPI